MKNEKSVSLDHKKGQFTQRSIRAKQKPFYDDIIRNLPHDLSLLTLELMHFCHFLR